MTEGSTLADLLTVYLYKNKYLSLPKLGRFDVSEDLDLSQPEMVEFSRIPKDGITFTSNTGEETDTRLVRYITEHTRKMHSLAVADLFTLTDQARQMLNIFQPVSFSGIGTLSKSIKGGIVFTPGAYKAELFEKYRENRPPSDFTKKTVSTIIHTKPGQTASVGVPSSRSMGGVVIIIICLLVAGVLVYFMLSQRGKEEQLKDVTVADTTSVPDSTANRPKQPVAPPVPKGMIHYDVVFEHAVDSARAFHRYNQLTGWGHKVVMRTADSVHYDLAIPFTTPASDTAKSKDSIRILYGRPTTIRYNTGR